MEFRDVLVNRTAVRGFKRNVVPQYCSIELISDLKASLATQIYSNHRAKCRHASDFQRQNRSQYSLTKIPQEWNGNQRLRSEKRRDRWI